MIDICFGRLVFDHRGISRVHSVVNYHHGAASSPKSRSSNKKDLMASACGELGTPEFFGRRFQTSMTRATVEESTAGLGQPLRAGRPLVGGLSFHGVSGLCTSSLAHKLPGGILAQGIRRLSMQD